MPKSRHTRKGKRRAGKRKGKVIAERPCSDDGRPLSIDLAVEIIAAAAARMWPNMMETILGEVMAAAPQDVRRDGNRLDGEAAGAALNIIRSVVENLAQSEVGSHNGWAWLFYLRRLPDELFQGRLATTAPYDEMLAVALSAAANATAELPALDSMVAPRLDDNALRPVFRLSAFAILLSDVHSKIRRAGKGQAFILHSDQLPESVSDPELGLAIQLYDERREADLGSALHAGTDVLSITESGTDSWPLLMVGRVKHADRRQTVLGWAGPMMERRFIDVQGRYGPVWMTVEHLAELATFGGGQVAQWWDPALPSFIVLLRALSYDLIFRSRNAGLNLPRTGYLLIARDNLVQLLDFIRDSAAEDLTRLLPGAEIPATGSDILSIVEGIRASAWPLLAGPIIRRAGEQLVIDLHSAAPRMVRMLTIPGDNPHARSRGTHFELVVQNTIDNTPWRPPELLRQIRGRTLTRQGTKVTDVDAIGTKDDILLLASCKSISYSNEYDAGKYEVVRNVWTRLEKDKAYWDTIVRGFRDQPAGDNYDFTGYRRIEGVVITPHVLFVHSGALTQEAFTGADDKPRTVSSIGELQRFLST
jgi:hypothetical protein